MKQDIVILELSSHEDSLYSHFLFLQECFNVHLIVNENLIPLIPKSASWASIQSVKIDGRKSLAVSWETQKLIRQIDPKIVFFHTAQGNIVRELVFLLPFKYKLTGLHHNADKLMSGKSFSQKIISWRVKNYFVLADYIKQNLAGKIDPQISLHDVYTIYYERPEGFRDLKKSRRLRIAIPGTVEQTRRDFLGLLEALKQTPLSTDVEFVILGNGQRGEGPTLQKELVTLGLREQFIFFDAYVSAADMASYMASSDLILPLLHPGMEYFELFSQYKISGSFNWAYGYQKPMLMHEAMASLPTFKPVVLSYTMDNLVESINRLAQDSNPLSEVRERIASDPRFNFELQKAKYLNFIARVVQ